MRYRRGRSTLVTWLGLAVIAAGVAAFLGLRPYLITHDNGMNHPAVGKPLESIQLVPLTANAEPVSSDDMAGHVTMINFWGTWCPPCVKEFPHLAELADRYSGRDDFSFLSVSCPGSTDDDLEALKNDTQSFLRSHKSKLAVFADPQSVTQKSAARAGAFDFGYPTTVVLDRQGIIRAVWNGYVTGVEHQMEEVVHKLLDEPGAVKVAG